MDLKSGLSDCLQYSALMSLAGHSSVGTSRQILTTDKQEKRVLFILLICLFTLLWDYTVDMTFFFEYLCSVVAGNPVTNYIWCPYFLVFVENFESFANVTSYWL